MKKNTVPSAPEDLLEPGQVFTDDGRKRVDEDFVGASNPDADPEGDQPTIKERSPNPAWASRR